MEQTKAYNSEMISKGRCEVEQGDVSNLKYQNQYDLATAFETIYFWPGLEKCFSKVNTNHHETKPWIAVIAEK